jgi:JmjC domain, hydroxylase
VRFVENMLCLPLNCIYSVLTVHFLFLVYRFVYLGPKGTATALHADVLRSFSWSTNVCGKKRWYFIPPLYAHLLYDCFGAKLAYHLFADICMDEGNCSVNFMSIMYPGLHIARQHLISVVQDAGDTIFVPSNWFHTVENIADTLSINHNWLNGANLHQCWCYVNSEVRSSTFSRSKESSMIPENSLLGNSSALDVNDVALSFWYVVGGKAKEFSQRRLDWANSTAFQMDLAAILLVIDGLLRLESDRFVSMRELNSVHDIIAIRREILDLLNKGKYMIRVD